MMSQLNTARNGLIVVGMILFLYQSYVSFLKFEESPTVVEESEEKWTNNHRPRQG
jgi:hypothetical protein